MNWFSFSTLRTIVVHPNIWTWKIDAKVKVKIKTNEKECLRKNTCLLKVILTITKKASVQCNVNFICFVKQWMDWLRRLVHTAHFAGGWTFRRTRWLTFIKFSCNAKLHTFYHISFTAAIYSSTISDRISSVHISDSASVLFLFLFFHFNRNNNKNSGSNVLHFCEQIIIFCACICHAMPCLFIHACKKNERNRLELVYSWIWTLLFSPCMKLSVFFLARLLTMFRFSLSKLFAIYFE